VLLRLIDDSIVSYPGLIRTSWSDAGRVAPGLTQIKEQTLPQLLVKLLSSYLVPYNPPLGPLLYAQIANQASGVIRRFPE